MPTITIQVNEQQEARILGLIDERETFTIKDLTVEDSKGGKAEMDITFRVKPSQNKK